MTEEEAKDKWCPFVRSTVVGKTKSGGLSCISNRDSAHLVEVNDIRVLTHNCIGSDCMAWRWRTTPVWVNKKTNAIEPYADSLRDHDFTEWYIGDQQTSHGHCGLAGKP